MELYGFMEREKNTKLFFYHYLKKLQQRGKSGPVMLPYLLCYIGFTIKVDNKRGSLCLSEELEIAFRLYIFHPRAVYLLLFKT